MVICHFVLSFLAVQMTNRQVAEKRWASPTPPSYKLQKLSAWATFGDSKVCIYACVQDMKISPITFKCSRNTTFPFLSIWKFCLDSMQLFLNLHFFVVPLNSFSWNFLRIEIKWTFHLHFYANQAIANRGGHSPMSAGCHQSNLTEIFSFFPISDFIRLWWHSDSLGRKN